MLDVVLDTDTYNEIDDQFALSYLLGNCDRLRTVALYAAPFHNERSEGPRDGMEKSYREILTLLALAGERFTDIPVFHGSTEYLPNEDTPVISDAARDLAERAMRYSRENPLHVVAIGAITNIASALLIRPEIAERIKIVWLGGHAYEAKLNNEFNLRQDVAAARVVIGSSAPFTMLPCRGVVDRFALSILEFRGSLEGVTPLADYLYKSVVEQVSLYSTNPFSTRIVWDVTAVAYLLNDGERFMKAEMRSAKLPTYALGWEDTPTVRPITYVTQIKREALAENMMQVITKLQRGQAS